MLIKMQRTRRHSDYIIFDKIENVVYETKPEVFLCSSDLQKFVSKEFSEAAPNEQITPWYEDSPDPTTGSTHCGLNKIVFTREGKSHKLYFDGEAFICNDDGKTIQRINKV